MKSFVVCAVLAVAVCQCSVVRNRRGIITEHHHAGGGGGYDGHGGATSYQNVHIENYHAVPVHHKYGDGEYDTKHKIGSYEHNVHINHGSGKHDPGHAIVSGTIADHGGEHDISSLSVGGHTDGGYSGEIHGNDDYSSGHELETYEGKEYDGNSLHDDGDSLSQHYSEGDDGSQSHYESYSGGDGDEGYSEYSEHH